MNIYSKQYSYITRDWHVVNMYTGRIVAIYSERADACNDARKRNDQASFRSRYAREFNQPTLSIAAD